MTRRQSASMRRQWRTTRDKPRPYTAYAGSSRQVYVATLFGAVRSAIRAGNLDGTDGKVHRHGRLGYLTVNPETEAITIEVPIDAARREWLHDLGHANLAGKVTS